MPDRTIVNTLAIKTIEFTYSINEAVHASEAVEFIIDDTSLSSLLGIERDLGNCCCDLDRSTKEILPEIHARYIDELNGRRIPSNQFGSHRLVLYRCHCGCDYCGVISCNLHVGIDHIEWTDVRFEDDGPTAKAGQSAISFRFSKDQYDGEIRRFTQGGV